MLKCDHNAIIYLGLSMPGFILIMVSIILIGALSEILSWKEAVDCLQGVAPMFITYAAAIVGFAFADDVPTKRWSQPSRANARTAQRVIRFWLSLGLPTALMLFHIGLATWLVVGRMKLSDYMLASAAVTWILAGLVSFIIGRFFGEAVKIERGPAPGSSGGSPADSPSASQG